MWLDLVDAGALNFEKGLGPPSVDEAARERVEGKEAVAEALGIPLVDTRGRKLGAREMGKAVLERVGELDLDEKERRS